MYSAFQLGIKYFKYYVTAANGKGHGVHSPFVFEFITHVLNNQRHFYAYQQVEELRKALLQDQSILTIEDYGAGSAIAKSNTRKVADIARAALKPKKYSQLLFRIVNY